jgi:hypothetical protein
LKTICILTLKTAREIQRLIILSTRKVAAEVSRSLR